MSFASPDEFREVMDKVLGLMAEDPEVSEKLRAADLGQRLEFDDLGLVVNVRPSREGEEGTLHWEWADPVNWETKVRLTMSSDTANRFFQGQEKVAMAFAQGRIRVGGDVRAALLLLPAAQPVFQRYRELVESEYEHLKV